MILWRQLEQRDNMETKLIEDRKDIETFVKLFYDKAFKDDLIGFIFVDIVKLDLTSHMPKIVDFWETILFDTPKYSGSPMDSHFAINKLVPLKPEFFERWVFIFKQTMDELFVGELAEKAKTRANLIAILMQSKMENQNDKM